MTKLSPAITCLISIREVHRYNICWYMINFTEILLWFRHPSRQMLEYCLKLGDYHFLPHFFLFIIY